MSKDTVQVPRDEPVAWLFEVLHMDGNGISWSPSVSLRRPHSVHFTRNAEALYTRPFDPQEGSAK